MRLALALALTLFAAPAVAQTPASSLTIRYTGLKSTAGQVVVALFNNEAAYKATENPIRTAKAPIPGTTVEVAWTGLPPGRYAAVAYHDKNGDGKLNTLPIGLPTEAYGFSNNARGRFGAPAWKAASFEVRAGETVQSVALK